MLQGLFGSSYSKDCGYGIFRVTLSLEVVEIQGTQHTGSKVTNPSIGVQRVEPQAAKPLRHGCIGLMYTLLKRSRLLPCLLSPPDSPSSPKALHRRGRNTNDNNNDNNRKCNIW